MSTKSDDIERSDNEASRDTLVARHDGKNYEHGLLSDPAASITNYIELIDNGVCQRSCPLH